MLKGITPPPQQLLHHTLLTLVQGLQQRVENVEGLHLLKRDLDLLAVGSTFDLHRVGDYQGFALVAELRDCRDHVGRLFSAGFANDADELAAVIGKGAPILFGVVALGLPSLHEFNLAFDDDGLVLHRVAEAVRDGTREGVPRQQHFAAQRRTVLVLVSDDDLLDRQGHRLVNG